MFCVYLLHTCVYLHINLKLLIMFLIISESLEAVFRTTIAGFVLTHLSLMAMICFVGLQKKSRYFLIGSILMIVLLCSAGIRSCIKKLHEVLIMFFGADKCKCLTSNTGMYQEQMMLNEYQRSKHK